MSLQTSQSIAEYCEREAGPYLRAVFHYEGDDYETLYVRDEVDDQYGEGELAAYFRAVTDAEANDARQADLLDVGDHHATLRLYDNALTLHFPQGSDIGTVVSLDPEAGRDVAAFVVRCLARLHETSRQDVTGAPDWDWL